MARIGSHGSSARRHRSAEARRAARRSSERKTAGREPAVRGQPGADHESGLSGGPSLRAHRDRIDGGSQRGLAGRREGLVQDVLRSFERRDRDRRRHRRRDRKAESRKVFWRHPARPARRALRVVGCQARRNATAGCAGSRPAVTLVPSVERTGIRNGRQHLSQPAVGCSGQRQGLTALQASGV